MSRNAIPSVNQLKKVIDPEVWQAREQDQRTLGAQDAWHRRRATSTQAAERVHEFLTTRAERKPLTGTERS